MSGTVRVLTNPLGGSPLSRLAQAGGTPGGWYPVRPASADQWRERAATVRTTTRTDWLESLGGAMAVSPGSVAAQRLAAVAGGAGVVVTTGQQPGLFGGAAYTWSKAISALALADALEAETGVPVAPVFWAATDDSDLAEASWTVISNATGAERLEMAASAPEGTRMADVPLPDVSAPLDALADACGSAADPQPIDAARAAYGKPTTVGNAYLELLRAILEPLGMAVLDASHPSVAMAAHPVLQRALFERERVRRALADRGAAIRAAGFAPQVHDVDDLTLVFQRIDGRRERVPLVRGAVAAATAPPGGLSPNVLLRPVVERSLLPTVAYVAGPAELAYFAQVSAVADALGAPAPLGVPRWSGTIIEARVQAVLDQYGLSVDDFADPHAVETRIARDAWPSPVAEAVTALRGDLAGRLNGVRDALGRSGQLVDPAVIDGLARAMSWRLSRLERRITASVRRRDDGLLRTIRMARGALYPEGIRQERALNLIPLMVRYGPALLDTMRAAASVHARGLAGVGEPTGVTP